MSSNAKPTVPADIRHRWREVLRNGSLALDGRPVGMIQTYLVSDYPCVGGFVTGSLGLNPLRRTFRSRAGFQSTNHT